MVAYDSVKQRLKLSDGWGYTKTFPVSEVWRTPATLDPKGARRRGYALLLGIGGALGALVGSLLTALLLR